MYIKSYRGFEITGHRDHAFATNESGAEYEGDIYDVETAIDRWWDDQARDALWRDAVAAIDALGVELDATLDSLDAQSASWAGGKQAAE